jgi:hypothetical protein
MTRMSKEEAEFFRYFDNVEVKDVKQESWERFVVPLSRYNTKEDNSDEFIGSIESVKRRTRTT